MLDTWIVNAQERKNKLGWVEPHSRFPLFFPIKFPFEILVLALLASRFYFEFSILWKKRKRERKTSFWLQFPRAPHATCSDQFALSNSSKAVWKQLFQLWCFAYYGDILYITRGDLRENMSECAFCINCLGLFTMKMKHHDDEFEGKGFHLGI